MGQLVHSEHEDIPFHASLFLFELSLAVMAMAMYMRGERPFDVFLPSNPGMVFVCAIIVFLIAGAVIISRYLAHKRSPSRHFRLVVTMNLVTVLLILLTGEIIVRAGSRSYRDSEVFGSIVLKPRDWNKVRLRYLEMLEGAADRTVMVYDDQLGWVVGSNRSSGDQEKGPFYASSADGLRAPHVGTTFPKVEGKTDIALIGDSFTFADRVSYEDTWGHNLGQLLGDKYRVLNFGVPGYGLGQGYLRYMRDAYPRSPKFVLFSFIDDDLFRTMRVYPFVANSLWRLPFSKPRFALQDGELRNINVKPFPPKDIFSHGSISELPSIEYDIGYRPSDWEKRWYHVSYLVRLVTSRFPAWEAARPEFSEEAVLSVNTEILKSAIRSVEQAGSIPFIAWFPSEQDFQESGSHRPIGKRMLEQAGISYIDPTPCLMAVNPADRFVGGHYSPQGNRAVAKCIYEAVKDSFAPLPSGSNPLRAAK